MFILLLLPKRFLLATCISSCYNQEIFACDVLLQPRDFCLRPSLNSQVATAGPEQGADATGLGEDADGIQLEP